MEDHLRLKEILSNYSQDDHVRVLFGDETDVKEFLDMVIIYRLIRLYQQTPVFGNY
jgi:hypothetical protein